MPKVSIIILTYNARSTLGTILDESIKSALEQDYANIEVLIVDNGSFDDTVEYVKKRFGDRVKIIKHGKNYGYCLGNDLALRYVDRNSKYLLFMNPDVILARDYVKKLITIAEKDPKIVALQGLETQPQRQHKRLGGSLNIAGFSLDLIPREDKSNLSCLESLFVFGAAMLVRRRVFEAVGGFSPDFFLYFDEADLGLRLRSLGLRIVGCKITSYKHYVSGTVSKIKETSITAYYFATKNRLRVIFRYFHFKYLLLALFINAIIIIYHIIKKPPMLRRVLMKALFKILKPSNLRKDLMIRKTYIRNIKKSKILERFVVLRI